MEGGYSSAGYCEVANNDQLEGRSSKSAASEDPGTLESSTPFAKSPTKGSFTGTTVTALAPTRGQTAPVSLACFTSAPEKAMAPCTRRQVSSRYPEFEAFLTHCPARLSLTDEETMQWDLHEEQDPFFYDYKRFLLNDDLTLPPETHIYSTDHSHMPLTRSLREDLDAWIFLHEVPPLVEDGEPWFIRNETPLMIKMHKQVYKFRNKKVHTSWNMGAILEGDRSGFARPGPKEQLSRQMILKAEEGDCDWIYGVLRDGLASPDVADVQGYTVLAAAAVHSHTGIISLLLDSGANVNKCTDEGLTPLSMCFLLYYPTRSFQPNVAERTVPKSQVSLSAPREAQRPLSTRPPGPHRPSLCLTSQLPTSLPSLHRPGSDGVE